jgi:hypothetical protein
VNVPFEKSRGLIVPVGTGPPVSVTVGMGEGEGDTVIVGVTVGAVAVNKIVEVVGYPY